MNPAILSSCSSIKRLRWKTIQNRHCLIVLLTTMEWRRGSTLPRIYMPSINTYFVCNCHWREVHELEFRALLSTGAFWRGTVKILRSQKTFGDVIRECSQFAGFGVVCCWHNLTMKAILLAPTVAFSILVISSGLVQDSDVVGAPRINERMMNCFPSFVSHVACFHSTRIPSAHRMSSVLRS